MAIVPKTEPPAHLTMNEPQVQRIPSPPTPGAIGAALDRIEEVLNVEEKALSRGGDVDLHDINRRKNHSLLELTRLSRIVTRDGLTPEMLTRIEAIRDRLKLNQDVLQVHLAAAQEISRVLTEALGDAESDGTYSRTVVPQSRGDR